MSGVKIKIDVDDSQVRDMLKRLARRMTDMRPVMAEIGEIVVESIQRNFDEQRSPDGAPWKPLTLETLKRKRHPDRILYETGTLFRSIHPEPGRRSVSIGTNIIYGAVHQLGYKPRNLPARPYLGVRDSDWPEIEAAIRHWLDKAESL